MRRRLPGGGVIAACLCALLVLLSASAGAAYPDGERRRERIFRITSPEITESSSLFAGTRERSLVYTTNDSGDGAVVYALDATNGALVGRTTLAGVEAVDVEALAGGADGSLVVADIGDNNAVRPSVSAYLLDQPSRGDASVDAVTVALTYADGPRDAEGAWYDADSGRLWVVSKEFVGASVYVSPPNVFERASARLRPIAPAPAIATDATMLPTRGQVAIRTYTSAVLYSFPNLKRQRTVALPPFDQGESITAPTDDDGVIWVGTEGERSPVVAVRLPQPPTPSAPSPSGSPSTSAPGSADTTDTADAGRSDAARVARVVLGAAGAGLLILAVAASLLRRRERHT